MMPRKFVSNDTLGTHLYAVEEDVRGLKRAFEARIEGLHKKFDERAKIPWPALSLVLGIIVAVGTLADFPIRERQAELRIDLDSKFKEAHQLMVEAAQEGLERDRRFLDLYLKLQADVARMEGRSGRD